MPSQSQSAAPITILTADDHPLIRSGITAVLASEPDMKVVAEAANGEEALEKYREHPTDVVLMDLSMPVMDGLSACEAIIAEFPNARIVMLRPTMAMKTSIGRWTQARKATYSRTWLALRLQAS